MRMVAEVRPDYPSEWAAIGAVAQRLGIGSSETLRKWIRQAEVDGGTRPGVTSEESAEIRRLRREVAELRRANVLWTWTFRSDLANWPMRGQGCRWVVIAGLRAFRG
jgi:transposase-like protein